MYNNLNDRTMSDIKLVSRYFRGELPRTEKEKDRTMDVMENI